MLFPSLVGLSQVVFHQLMQNFLWRVEYSLVLARKLYLRSWRTCCTSVLRGGNWGYLSLSDQTTFKVFSGFSFLKVHSSVVVADRSNNSLASRVALIKWREQAQQFKFPPTNRAVASSSLLIGPRHSSPALVFFSETSRSSLQVEHLSSKVLSRMRETARRRNRT